MTAGMQDQLPEVYAACRSLDEVELSADDIEEGQTLTGLRPITKDQLTEEHDEMMKEVLAEMGAESDPAFEDVCCLLCLHLEQNPSDHEEQMSM